MDGLFGWGYDIRSNHVVSKSFLEKISCEEKTLRMMDIDLDWMNGTIG